MKSIKMIKAVLAGMEADIAKVDAGQKAAGVRVRAGLMAIKTLCAEAKKESLGR